MKNQCRRASVVAAAGGYGASGRPLSEGDIAARPFAPDEVFRLEADARAFMDSEFGG